MATFATLGTISSLTIWLSFFITAICSVAYNLIYRRQTKRWEQTNIPFLQPTFFIGHKYFLSTAKYSVAVPLDKIYKENKKKDLIAFFMGMMPVILLSDEKLIRQVFSKNLSLPVEGTFVSFEPGKEPQSITEVNNRMDFLIETVSPVFSFSWYSGSRFERIKETIYDMLHKVENIRSDGSSIIIKKVTKDAVLNLSNSIFGIDSDSHANDVRTIVDNFYEPSYQKMMIFYGVSLLSSLQRFEYFKLFSSKSLNTLSEILKYQINRKKQINTETGDFVDILLALDTNKLKSKNICSKDSNVSSISKGVPTKEMAAMAMGILLAGSDTIHTLLDFTIHALSLYPEYQYKIRKEVHEAMEKNGVAEFNFQVVRSLSFTFKCLFEASRLYPSAPMSMRVCVEDFQIPGKNYVFRKGDRVIIPVYSVDRDEYQFRNPESFDPERFTSKEENLAIPTRLLSFGTGPKKCKGYTHGLFLAASLLASLVYKYEIKPRSHLKLMDATDFYPQGISSTPRNDIIVDLVPCESETQ